MSEDPIIANLDIERKLCGAILVDPTRFNEPGVSSVKSEDFYQKNAGIVWRVLLDLKRKNKTINLDTAADALKRVRKFKAAGGENFLLQLMTEAETVGVSRYAEIIKADANRRYALQVAGKLAKKAYDPSVGPLELWNASRDEVKFGLTEATELANHYEPVTLSDVQNFVQEISYLWDPWIPKGLLTMEIGAVESGKSCLATWLSKSVIEGGEWLDGQKVDGGGRVVWVEQEAGEALLIDRVTDWGMDGSKIIFPGIDPLDEINLLSDEGWAAFERSVRLLDVRLAVIDSLGGSFLRENDPEVKILVKRLALLARDVDIGLILIHHPRKLRIGEHDSITLDRIRGFSGIIQFPRSIMSIERPNPNEPETRRLRQIKLNMKEKAQPIGFDLVRGYGLQPCDPPETVRTETQMDRAIDVVRSQLSKGAKRASEIYDMAEGLGISDATLRKAKKKLNVLSVKKGDTWYWSFPAKGEDDEWWANV